jgi:hypothetical protein
MIKHPDSHMDHDITPAQWDYIFSRFAGRSEFLTETLELPEDLGSVANALYGPSCGDPPVFESEVHYVMRGTRAGQSRMIDRPKRATRWVRVIAGPHDGNACVLYTAYGVADKDMPTSPREPWDPACSDIAASKAFWAVHALAG